jgi:hypothetical protein
MARGTRKHRKGTKKTQRRVRRSHRQRRQRRQRGGNLGVIPRSAIVSVRQDEYSAPMLVDMETAEDMFDGRNSGY